MKLPIPYQMAVSTVHLKLTDQSIKKDRYGRTVSSWEGDITNCVVNMQATYSGTNNDRKITANGLVIMYAGYSEPVPALTKENLESKLTYQGKEYTVSSINRFDQPGTEELYCYELEVI
ncbi:hypothetical protein BTH55_03060 [Lactobacillus delbrueckii subsp. bulgaricus]|nr:hypothetical protein [Lactobacillus delbrueckii subsp. bulgaricus]MBT8856849.1 hypothetical protein [Lactobacillus delbrueckii subsp. bulgaricus]MBT8866572.1 hypothetical protein [Lactobacillus delbrueckii subsp. bulgaricus]